MRILIDADGCPVVNETIKVAHKFNLESIIFCDTSHNFDEKNIKVIHFLRNESKFVIFL